MRWIFVQVICLVKCLRILGQHLSCTDEEKRLIALVKENMQSPRNAGKCESYDESKRSSLPPNMHLLQYHIVCYGPAVDNKKFYVAAKMRPVDVGQGTKAKDVAKKNLRSTYKSCGCDQAGHIVPRELGGSGYIWNLFAQNGNLNMGHWSTVCKEIISFLRHSDVVSDRHSAFLRIHFEYEDSEHRLCPSSYFYKIDLYAKEVNVQTIHGFFENEDHRDSNLRDCSGDGRNRLIVVSNLDDDYFFNRRSCKFDQSPSQLYGIKHLSNAIPFRHVDL